jgi:hypothetical protein
MRGRGPDRHAPLLVLLERHPWILAHVWELGLAWLVIGTPLLYLGYAAMQGLL